MPDIGFLGFLDFVGYPVGGGIFVPTPTPTPSGHGFRGAGLYLAYMMATDKRRRRKKKEGITIGQVAMSKSLLDVKWEEERTYRKNIATSQMYAVLLSEV
jgi:hypothetical protein